MSQTKGICGCAIVGVGQLDRLMRKYLGLLPDNLTNDEREILLFALYMESVQHGGIGAKATAIGDARVAEAKAKLDAIIAGEIANG
jgi:hypothetical protein